MVIKRTREFSKLAVPNRKREITDKKIANEIQKAIDYFLKKHIIISNHDLLN